MEFNQMLEYIQVEREKINEAVAEIVYLNGHGKFLREGPAVSVEEIGEKIYKVDSGSIFKPKF
ncbi:MAG: hypothetical protein Q7U10_07990 [Thermodesulfovibrionia bacterium]|nr:hypothetical protein [Thermodesulfovibrionia bacterium]